MNHFNRWPYTSEEDSYYSDAPEQPEPDYDDPDSSTPEDDDLRAAAWAGERQDEADRRSIL